MFLGEGFGVGFRWVAGVVFLWRIRRGRGVERMGGWGRDWQRNRQVNAQDPLAIYPLVSPLCLGFPQNFRLAGVFFCFFRGKSGSSHLGLCSRLGRSHFKCFRWTWPQETLGENHCLFCPCESAPYKSVKEGFRVKTIPFPFTPERVL